MKLSLRSKLKKKITNFQIIIPARAGSKRIPHKNTKLFKGISLYKYTINQALRLFPKKNIIITSNEKKIINFCIKNKIKFISRDEKLCSDKAKNIDVIQDAIIRSKDKNDNIIYLQITSPLRKDEDIIKGINLFLEKKAHGIISINESFAPNEWQKKLNKNLNMKNFFSNNKKSLISSQDLPKYYQINGSFFIFQKKVLLNAKSLYGISKTFGCKISKINSIDIDNEEDFLIAERLFKLN